MTDDKRHTRQPLSMTRRYRRGLILTGCSACWPC